MTMAKAGDTQMRILAEQMYLGYSHVPPTTVPAFDKLNAQEQARWLNAALVAAHLLEPRPENYCEDT